MENRSNHVLVGGVVLTLVVITLGFLVWMAGFSGPNDQKFDIFFRSSVDGLAKGSVVAFSGVPVGNVEDIALMPASPEFVRVRIKVKEGVPVLRGTTATIAGVGFTGVSQINLDGAVKGAAPIACNPNLDPDPACPDGFPVIPTKPGALGQLLNSAPVLLERVTTLTDRLGQLLNPANQNSIGHILANLDRLSGSLADRGPEIAQTLVETRVAIRQAGVAAQQIGALADTTNGVMQRDVAPAMANFNKAANSAQRSLATLDATLADARPGIKTLTNDTIPNANELIRDLSQMAESLSAVANKLDRGGAGALVGGGKLPDYKPRK
ncbi:MAG TPA: MlaD family protein [Sphingomonas sp.]|jgi:phospholipid/cholesterol/gamma-HCH transport system substrate-binding protein|uniref:MlaD family protein n=1 Tax=Sphingomonas sp. TaxID=28214 RepID=UPI002EDB06B4